jgi:hypothetical protein
LSIVVSICFFKLNVSGYFILRVIFLPKTSKRFTVTTRMRGAKLILNDFVAFYLLLQTGHKYLLSLVSLSIEQNYFNDS